MSTQLAMKYAREATVAVHGPDDALLGHGLLIWLPREGPTALTCDHVVAQAGRAKSSGHLRLVRARPDGTPQTLTATWDRDRSIPDRDVAVLTLDDPPAVAPNPLVLHVPDPLNYRGPLNATGLIPAVKNAQTFTGKLVPNGPMEVKVPGRDAPYILPASFGLGRPSETRAGISGSPVLVEGGIVGLTHFARSETAQTARAAYVNPLTAWLPTLPRLDDLLEPFVDETLRARATLLTGRGIDHGKGVAINGPITTFYFSRTAQENLADQLLEAGHTICVVGSEGSGKTRFVMELCRRHPDARIVVPEDDPPGEARDASGLAEGELLMLYENVHMLDEPDRLKGWYRHLHRINRNVIAVLTSRNADDWTAFSEKHEPLLRELHAEPVYLSREEGDNLSDDEAQAFVDQCTDADLTGFDGTPLSLLQARAEPPRSACTLPPGRKAGAAIRAAPREDADIPHTLPEITNRFIERPRTMPAAIELLRTRRVVCLTGPEGRGKTRTALELGWRVRDRYPQGVWWVDLVGTDDAGAVTQTIALVIGAAARATATRLEDVRDRLRAGRQLLILNGVEEAIDATRDVVEALRDGCPDLTILTTGTVALGLLDGESALEVPVMPLSATVELLRDRLAPDSAATAALVDAVSERLDGNPLAVELSAARAADEGIESVLAQLEADRDARRSEGQLVDDVVTQTLRDLGERQAKVFRRLGVFPGSFTQRAAIAVVAGDGIDRDDVPAILRELVDRRLVVLDERDEDVQRLRLVGALRRHAGERLRVAEEMDEARERHARHYLGRAEDAAGRMYGEFGSQWVGQLARERANMRVAATWAVRERRMDLALRLGAALWRFWQLRGPFREGRERLDGMLALLGPDDEVDDDTRPALMEALNGAGSLAFHACDYAAALDYHQRCLSLREEHDHARVSGSLNNIGLVARRRGQYGDAYELFLHAIDLSRHHHASEWLAIHTNNLGNCVRERRGDLEQADTLQQNSASLFRSVGSKWGYAMALCDRGYVLMDLGDPGKAREKLGRSLEIRQGLQDQQGILQSLNGLGILDRLDGHPEVAIERHRRALWIADRIGDRLRTAESLERLAFAEWELGRPDDTAALLDAADGIRADISAPLPPSAAEKMAALRAEVGAGSTPAAAPAAEQLRDLLRSLDNEQPPDGTIG